MKFKYLKAMMFLSVLGTFTACQDDMLESGHNGIQLDENGMATITINVTTEDVLATRAAETDPTQSYISTGDKIDKLIYAIYKKKANEYELQTYFADEDGILVPEDQSNQSGSTTTGLGKGQLSEKFKVGDTKCILLKVDPDATYKIVCWAQASSCTAYDTQDLTQVKVSYDDANNNDETRDAFCGSSSDFTDHTKELTVVLRRPFAQINVGTTGADYKFFSENYSGATYYTFSKVEFTGLANRINVLTGENYTGDNTSGATAGTDGEKTVSATFKWATLPAWIKCNIDNLIAEKPGINAKVWAQGEEFLLVDLNSDSEIKSYLTEYNTQETGTDGKVEYLTETFKYLSMSYVLVPSAAGTTPSVDEDKNEVKNGSVIGVTVWFNDQPKDEAETASRAKFSLKNVPAARNWRTNILGGFYEGSPNNPDDPDTPPSLFDGTHIHVVVATNYFGNSTTTETDWNQENQNPSWKHEDNDYSPDDDEVEVNCPNNNNGSGQTSSSRSKK